MQRRFVALGLLVAGIINLLPLPGALGASWLQSLYGIQIGSPDLQILLQHRAILFGIVGALLIAAIFVPTLRPAAMIAGAVSMVSFIVIAAAVGGYNSWLSRVVAADIVGLLALVVSFFGSRAAMRV